MFEPGDIVYGFVPKIGKPKYAISIYRDEDLNILLYFTTSKDRAGVAPDLIQHGPIFRQGECISFVFEAHHEIGVAPSSGDRFSFPKRTAMVFDYGLLKADERHLNSMFVAPKVVCKLDGEEYINLVYAMYRSRKTPQEHKPYLEKVLKGFYEAKTRSQV